jgi:HSP20 family molecular chaperone IbpA
MLDDFDRYAAQQLGSTQGSTSVATFSPKFDVAEHDKEYALTGELPGVAPENVEIEFTDDQTLVVRGHSEREHTEGDPALLGAPEEAKKIEGGEKSKDTAMAKGKGKEGGEQAEQAEKPKARYWLSERSHGEFSRVFSFPSAVDQDRVQAKFKDGLLNITVPKAEKRGGKKIPIQ